jgi:hypothetical protein
MSGRLKLSRTAPGIEARHIQEQTGFELGLTGEPVPEIPEPSLEELWQLRGEVRRQLERIYPEYSRTAFGSEDDVTYLSNGKL